MKTACKIYFILMCLLLVFYIKTVALIAAALIGILVIGIFCYFLTRNNEKYIDVVDAESDQWNESHAEIEFNEIS